MPNSNSRLTKLIKKGFRNFSFLLLFIFLVINLFIILSGRFYLYKGIANTYLKGHSGPSIYDLNVFHNATIQRADIPYNWVSKGNYNFSQAENELMNRLETSSFLVIKNDTIITENYFGSHVINTVSNSFSAAKTVVALLVGIAIEEGKIKGLDDKVGDYLPEFAEGEKSKITIRHLLMMASGLDWEESGKNPLSENAESYYGTDLYRLVTQQKVVQEPGKIFNYQSGNSQLLAFIVEKATGIDLATYAAEKIWKKMGAEHDAFWSLDKKNGDEKAFCCIYGTSRDFAKLGKLFLNNGKWEGNTVIPEWYMKEVVSNPEMNTDEGIPNFRYGLHVWTYQWNEKKVVYCRGILGQYIIAIPADNLVIVRTGSKRDPNFKIPKDKLNDKAWIEKNAHKIGHPTDLFNYLELANRIQHEN